MSLRGADYPAWALDALAARGVDLAGIHDLGRSGGRAWLLYEGRRRQIVHWMDRPTHAEVSPTAAHVPPAWAAARAFHIAPMPFEVQEALAEELSRRRDVFVSVDPWLVLRPDTLEPWRRVLDQVDAFFPNEDEMEILLALDAVRGDSLDLEMEIDPGPASEVALLLRRSADGRQETRVAYDRARTTLAIDRERSGAGDGGVHEAPLALEARGGRARLVGLRSWRLASATPHTLPGPAVRPGSLCSAEEGC